LEGAYIPGRGLGNRERTPFGSELRRNEYSIEELRKSPRNLRMQTTDFRLKTSDFRLRASDFFAQR